MIVGLLVFTAEFTKMGIFFTIAQKVFCWKISHQGTFQKAQCGQIRLIFCFLPWSSLVEGDEGLYMPNCQTNLVIAIHAPSLLFKHFINTTAYHLGRYKPSSPASFRTPRSDSSSRSQNRDI